MEVIIFQDKIEFENAPEDIPACNQGWGYILYILRDENIYYGDLISKSLLWVLYVVQIIDGRKKSFERNVNIKLFYGLTLSDLNLFKGIKKPKT